MTVEWYDLRTAGALILNGIFFPRLGPMLDTFAAFGTYGAGVIGVGHFGDRIGRELMLIATLLLIGLPSVATGLIDRGAAKNSWRVCHKPPLTSGTFSSSMTLASDRPQEAQLLACGERIPFLASVVLLVVDGASKPWISLERLKRLARRSTRDLLHHEHADFLRAVSTTENA